MKRIISLLFCLLLIFSISAAEAPDLSAMSFDDLVALRDQLNLAIWNSREWQEVTVPAGVFCACFCVRIPRVTEKCPGCYTSGAVCYALHVTAEPVDFPALVSCQRAHVTVLH